MRLFVATKKSLSLRPEKSKGRIFMKGTGITNTKRLVGTALFAALAYLISFFEFPIFPAAPFLKLDFSAVFVALAAFIFGRFRGLWYVLLKNLSHT